MKKNLTQRGITFYKLLTAFFITTFICTMIITSQYIHFLNKQELQMQESYSEMASTVFTNLSSIVMQFEDYGEALAESAEKNPDAENLWNNFFRIYNSKMSGAANVSYLYLRNSSSVLGLGSPNPVKGEEITDNLGLTEASWNQLVKSKDQLTASFEKTDIMTYGRLMLAKEIYPDVVLIAGIAEENLERAIRSCYLPPRSEITFTTRNNQGVSFQTLPESRLGNAVYKNSPFSDQALPDTNLKRNDYYYSALLCQDALKAEVLIPNDYSGKRTCSLVLSVILALAIWIICGGSFSYLLTRKLYQPVEELLSILPKGIPLQRHFHEFHLVGQTLEALSAENKVYEEQLEKQNSYLACSLWIRILHGELSVTEEVVSVLKNAGFPAGNSPYAIVQIMIMPEPRQEIQKEDLLFCTDAAIPAKLLQDTEQYLQGQQISSYFSEENGYLTGLVRCDSCSGEALYQWFTGLKQKIQEQYEVQVSISVSCVHQTLADLHTAFLEASHLTEYNILMEDYDSISVTGYTIPLSETSFLPKNRNVEIVHRLSACLQCSQFSDAIPLLNQIFESLPVPSPENILESTRELTYLLDTMILSLDPAEFSDAVSQLSVNRQSLRKRSLKDTLNYLTDMLTRLQSQKEEASSPHQKILQIRKYIQEHYTECSLSAQVVADCFQVSIPWLSTTFKRETKEGFLEYIHKYRIAKAQELIASTSLSIKEISEKVGYTNYITMSRAFKRYTGVTPKWYRSS